LATIVDSPAAFTSGRCVKSVSSTHHGSLWRPDGIGLLFSALKQIGWVVRHWCRSVQAGLLSVFAAVAAAQAQPPSNQPDLVLAADLPLSAQPSSPSVVQSSDQDRGSAFLRFFRDAEWYFTWGYNKEYFAPADIHVSQSSLGNNFTISDVRAHDEAGLSTDPFGPQYIFRIGRFLDGEKNFAVELNFDHTKYTTSTGQGAHVSGTIGGVPVNGNFPLGAPFFYEELHNGANHLMLNGVYRMPLLGETNETLSVAAIAKAGLGVMLPHTTDTILGNTNDVGMKTLGNSIGLTNGWWQLNGWTAGAEFGFRVVLYKPIYIELTDKIAYARLSDLPAFQGTLQQSLWMNEIIFGIGFTYDGVTSYAHR
jgi:hypothetical protein